LPFSSARAASGMSLGETAGPFRLEGRARAWQVSGPWGPSSWDRLGLLGEINPAHIADRYLSGARKSPSLMEGRNALRSRIRETPPEFGGAGKRGPPFVAGFHQPRRFGTLEVVTRLPGGRTASRDAEQQYAQNGTHVKRRARHKLTCSLSLLPTRRNGWTNRKSASGYRRVTDVRIDLPNAALLAGSVNEPVGTHTSRTIMLQELMSLFDAASPAAIYEVYQHAAVVFRPRAYWLLS
jgi:hypothetical protein